MSNEAGPTPIPGSGVLEPSEQVVGTKFPLHAAQTDHHSVQNAELGKLRSQSLVVQHHDRKRKSQTRTT